MGVISEKCPSSDDVTVKTSLGSGGDVSMRTLSDFNVTWASRPCAERQHGQDARESGVTMELLRPQLDLHLHHLVAAQDLDLRRAVLRADGCGEAREIIHG